MRQHCPCVAQHACFKEPLPTGVCVSESCLGGDQSRTHRVRARHLPSANMFSREKPLTAHRPCLFTHFHSPTRPLSPTRLAFAASPPRQDHVLESQCDSDRAHRCRVALYSPDSVAQLLSQRPQAGGQACSIGGVLALDVCVAVCVWAETEWTCVALSCQSLYAL